MNPGSFGIFDFIHSDAKTYIPKLGFFETEEGIVKTRYKPVLTHTFWDILSKEGIRTIIIRWPATFPAKKLNGRMLSGFGTPT